ncbi:hypothetical protein O9992_15565 [Vibrio lentus]|nr:hypothetical protein [Vibrio lentus]
MSEKQQGYRELNMLLVSLV